MFPYTPSVKVFVFSESKVATLRFFCVRFSLELSIKTAYGCSVQNLWSAPLFDLASWGTG